MSTLLLTFAVPDGTGATLMMVEYAQALCRAGHEVILAHGDSTAKSPTLPEAGKRFLKQIAEAGVTCIPCAGYRKPYSGELRAKLIGIAKDCRVDAVLGFQQLDRKYAMSVAKSQKVPCVIGAFNKHTFWGPKPVAWFKRFVYTRMLRQTAELIVCTSEEVEREIHLDFKIPKERTVLVRNGLSMPDNLLNDEVRIQKRRALGVADGELLFCNIARIDEQKGQDLLLDALGSFTKEKWHLLLVGNVSPGPNSDRMEQFKKLLERKVIDNKLQNRVSFLGWRDDLRELLTATDFYVHPSRWEGWPLAVLHAMAEATPFVASDCVEPPIGFESGVHGFMFENGNVESLKQAIDRAFEIDDFSTMGHACRNLARANYDIGDLSQLFVNAVNHTLAISAKRSLYVDSQ